MRVFRVHSRTYRVDRFGFKLLEYVYIVNNRGSWLQ